ncbi:hypothetical protein MRX96_029559 [Rhipicephalus microplus]
MALLAVSLAAVRHPWPFSCCTRGTCPNGRFDYRFYRAGGLTLVNVGHVVAVPAGGKWYWVALSPSLECPAHRGSLPRIRNTERSAVLLPAGTGNRHDGQGPRLFLRSGCGAGLLGVGHRGSGVPHRRCRHLRLAGLRQPRHPGRWWPCKWTTCASTSAPSTLRQLSATWPLSCACGWWDVRAEGAVARPSRSGSSVNWTQRAAVLTRTTTQRAASRTALALPRPSGQSLNSRLLWLAFYAESSSRVAMTVSSVCIQTTAILARVAFPAVVEIPCYQYMSSLPILLVVRLLLEQLAASQASRWPQSCGRLVFLFSGYIVSSMALLLHFQTYVHQGGLVRAAHDARLRYVTLVHGRSSETHLGDASGRLRFFPVLLFRALGFVSAAMLVWPVGRIDQFDGALAWASLALMLGCSAATISFVAAALRPSRMRVRS